MVTGSNLTEGEDRWRLPYRGMPVTQIKVSYQLTLVLDGAVEIQIETESQLTRGSIQAPGVAIAQLVPERQDVAPALALFGATILFFDAFKTGALRVVFDSGVHLNVKPHPDYEAWNVHGPGGLVLVCQPGGGVAFWS